MAKANIILLNSILWNLRELTKLAEKIKKQCGDVDCISWRYPLTSCSELEIFKLLQNNRNLDNYTYILELTYDRLLYLFNLMIKYLESMESLKKFRPSKNVSRPKTLSLASVLHMIWDRIRAQAESANQAVVPEFQETEQESENILKVTELNVTKSSIYTQSELCSISLCSCCEMVQQFVTQLVIEMEKVLETQDFCSAISSERKVMREHLMDMTNWSAMSRWLNAIVKDFTALSERVNQVTVHSRKLKNRLESDERKMKFKVEQQEEETRKLENRIKDYEAKIQDLKHKLDKADSEKNSLDEELKQKNCEIETKCGEFEKKIAGLKKNYEFKLREKERKLKKSLEKEQEFQSLLEDESKKFEEVKKQNEALESTICQLKEEMDTLTVKTTEDEQSMRVKLKEAENEISTLRQKNYSLQSILHDKEETLNDYSKRIMEAFPELHHVPKYRATGNPEVDMESQIKANRLRVELLQSENESLQGTLNKIKQLKG